MTRYLTASIGAVAAALGFAAPAHASFDDQYVCEAMGDVDILVVMSSRDSSMASVQFTTGIDSGGIDPGGGGTTTEPMRQIPAASGMKYAGLGLVFHAKGDEGILETESGSVACRFAGEEASDPMDEETDAYAQSQSLELAARSWGGKVRAGPGMEFDQVASLYEGEPITLLVNTGKRMGDYDWFFIRLADGREGYQWGGIICSDTPGAFSEMECPGG